jgi:cysteine desulfuration protein SufE
MDIGKMTIDELQDKIIDQFSTLNDWIEKCEYLIDIGKKHPLLDPKYKNENNALPGCQSQVWIYSKIKDGKLLFLTDSDSIIIRGILSLLSSVLDNQAPGDVANANLYFVKEIGLSTNLSPSRANGLFTIIKRMQNLGSEAVKHS